MKNRYNQLGHEEFLMIHEAASVLTQSKDTRGFERYIEWRTYKKKLRWNQLRQKALKNE